MYHKLPLHRNKQITPRTISISLKPFNASTGNGGKNALKDIVIVTADVRHQYPACRHLRPLQCRSCAHVAMINSGENHSLRAGLGVTPQAGGDLTDESQAFPIAVFVTPAGKGMWGVGKEPRMNGY